MCPHGSHVSPNPHVSPCVPLSPCPSIPLSRCLSCPPIHPSIPLSPGLCFQYPVSSCPSISPYPAISASLFLHVPLSSNPYVPCPHIPVSRCPLCPSVPVSPILYFPMALLSHILVSLLSPIQASPVVPTAPVRTSVSPRVSPPLSPCPLRGQRGTRTRPPRCNTAAEPPAKGALRSH